jgi:hypothetical protein
MYKDPFLAPTYFLIFSNKLESENNKYKDCLIL